MGLEKKPFEILTEHIARLEYGSVIEHSEISRLISTEYGSHKYRTIVDQAKAALLQQGKGIESVKGYGYRVIYPDDYILHSARHMKFAASQMSKGQKYCDYAPIEQMSDDAKASTIAMQDKISQVSSFLNSQMPVVNRLSRKKSPFALACERQLQEHRNDSENK